MTLTDVLAAIVGELSVPGEAPRRPRHAAARGRLSWLVDGDVGIERLKSVLDIGDDLPGEEEHSFNTVGGLIMHVLGRIPAAAAYFRERLELENCCLGPRTWEERKNGNSWSSSEIGMRTGLEKSTLPGKFVKLLRTSSIAVRASAKTASIRRS